MFKQATKQQSKLRMTLDGPAGSGKTYTALRFAHALANGGRIAFIDTERGSASKYVGEAPDGIPWDFDVDELTNFSPEKYTEAISAAGRGGYSVLVIDSLSHAWEGVGGALELKDKAASSTRDNQYTAWRIVTPIHNRMIDSILQSPCHIITTMRSSMEYVQDVNEFGKVVGIRKVGMAPRQRPGAEYEFDIVGDIDWAHILTISKSRCSAIADMKVEKPGASFMIPVIEWLFAGASVKPEPVFIPATPEITLDSLVETYGAEAVMVANGGNIPVLQDELNQVSQKLGEVK